MTVNYISNKRQEQMLSNGWRLMLSDSLTETAEEMVERLSERYSQVKVYWVATRIRGYHKYIAFVKR